MYHQGLVRNLFVVFCELLICCVKPSITVVDCTILFTRFGAKTNLHIFLN